MWYDWQPKPSVNFSGLFQLCPVDHYKVLKSTEVPSGILAPGLLAKASSVLVACSGTGDGRTFVMLNVNRTDLRAGMIDQNPYAIAIDGSSTIPSGVLIQHGKYHPQRSVPIPSGFQQHVSGAGVFPISELPANDFGKIGDLKVGSQLAAWDLLTSILDSAFPRVEIDEGELRTKAYFRWINRGRPSGDDLRDWFEAIKDGQ